MNSNIPPTNQDGRPKRWGSAFLAFTIMSALGVGLSIFMLVITPQDPSGFGPAFGWLVNGIAFAISTVICGVTTVFLKIVKR